MFGLSDVTFFKFHIRLTITTPRSGGQLNCTLEKVLANLIHAEGHSRKTCACNIGTTMSQVFKLDYPEHTYKLECHVCVLRKKRIIQNTALFFIIVLKLKPRHFSMLRGSIVSRKCYCRIIMGILSLKQCGWW